MMPAPFFDRENGQEIWSPSDLIDKEMDREDIAFALGRLMDLLLEREVITPTDVLYVLPQAARWCTIEPLNGEEK